MDLRWLPWISRKLIWNSKNRSQCELVTSRWHTSTWNVEIFSIGTLPDPTIRCVCSYLFHSLFSVGGGRESHFLNTYFLRAMCVYNAIEQWILYRLLCLLHDGLGSQLLTRARSRIRGQWITYVRLFWHKLCCLCLADGTCFVICCNLFEFRATPGHSWMGSWHRSGTRVFLIFSRGLGPEGSPKRKP